MDGHPLPIRGLDKSLNLCIFGGAAPHLRVRYSYRYLERQGFFMSSDIAFSGSAWVGLATGVGSLNQAAMSRVLAPSNNLSSSISPMAMRRRPRRTPRLAFEPSA